MSELSYIEKNLALVMGEVEDAARRAGRDTQPLMLAAVKYAEDAELDALLSLGVGEVGENRVQQLLDHLPLYEKHGTRVHFIGSLQTNKVKYIIDKVAMIHSVDSTRLASEIERRAAAKDVTVDVLVEINGAREAAKSGVLPEDAEALCREILQMPHIRLRGFMTMGPVYESDEEYRAYFASVKEIGDGIWQAIGGEGKPLYSMGMSDSFVPAIAAGADMVRVGRRLFLK